MTKLGKGVLLLIVGLFIPAVNTGINSLYLVTSLLTSLFIISIVVSKIYIKNLSIERFVPDEVFQDTPFPVRIRLTNKGRMSKFLLMIEDGVYSPSNAIHLITKIKAGDSIDLTYLHRVPERGIWKVGFCQVKTSFPFGLWESSVRYAIKSKVLVLPKPLDDYQLSISPSSGRTFGRSLYSPLHGLDIGQDFHRIDEYRSGDSARWIHWRSSAKRGQLMVRRFEKEVYSSFAIVLNDSKEYAVRLAATAANTIYKTGGKFQLIAWDSAEGLRMTPLGGGLAHLMNALRMLALIKQSPIPADIMKGIDKYIYQLSTVLIVSEGGVYEKNG